MEDVEEMYSDPISNRQANDIIDKIEKVARPMMSPTFSMALLHNTGLRVAEDLLNSCLSDLKNLKLKVGFSDETYLEISSALAVTASGIVKMPVSAISLLANSKDFNSDKDSVARSKADLIEARKLMNLIADLDMNLRAKQTINQNMDILLVAQQRVDKVTSWYKFW